MGLLRPTPSDFSKHPDGREVKIPVLRDAAGATFIDVRRLYPETGICTFDPGTREPRSRFCMQYV